MKLAVWSPLPPSPSGIADYVSEQLGPLARELDVRAVVTEPEAVDDRLRRTVKVVRPEDAGEADLHVYHLGNSPAHAYVYRAALAVPGVAFLHDWSLHHLVLSETVERGDVASYLREMRRAHGEAGSFVARQVARDLGGGILPAQFPLNDRVLESSLAVVGLSGSVQRRAATRLPGRPTLHLPHHLAIPLDPLPGRSAARRALGLPEDALLVTAPGLATASKRLDVGLRAVARLRSRFPGLRLVVAGAVDPRLPLESMAEQAGVRDRLILTGRVGLDDFVRHLAASDVVFALRFPSYGEVSGALVRALGVGRPALVTAETPVADEFPEGVVARVDPGPFEEADLTVLLDALLQDAPFRATMEAVARDHVRAHHDLERVTSRLAAFLRQVHARREALTRALAAERAPEGTLLGYLMEEVRWGARELGLPGVQLGLGPVLGRLAGEEP